MSESSVRTQVIAQLNDAFRQTFSGGRCVITRGVAASPHMARVCEAVQHYVFDEVDGNNPYGENDFGTVTIEGETYFWKIDYYDRNLEVHSPDPADPAVTQRVLTIMCAKEY